MATINAAVHNQNQLARYQNVTVSGVVAAADTGPVTVLPAPKSAKHQYFIRRVVTAFAVAVVNNAVVFESITTGAPVFGVNPAAVDPQNHHVNYGEIGFALPPGEGLQIVLDAAGNEFGFVVEAFVAPIPQSGGVLLPSQVIP